VPYLTPQALPESDDCRSLSIPADTEWLALFGGALTELLFLWNWEQSEGGLTPSETVAEMQRLIDAWYESVCGCTLPDGEPLLRVGENGMLQELIDGSWQEPTGDYYIPPPAARENPTASERRCLAAANAVNVLQLLYEEISDGYANNLSVANALAGMVILTAVLVAPPVGAVVAGLAAAALGIWQLAYNGSIRFINLDRRQSTCIHIRWSIQQRQIIT